MPAKRKRAALRQRRGDGGGSEEIQSEGGGVSENAGDEAGNEEDAPTVRRAAENVGFYDPGIPRRLYTF